jgi:UDP-N-acetyl-D-galactosamine dehydrogenase
VVDVITHLENYGMHTTIYDPWASPSDVKKEYELITTQKKPKNTFDAIVLTVAHKEFVQLDLKPLLKKKSVVYDVKGVLGLKADAKL